MSSPGCFQNYLDAVVSKQAAPVLSGQMQAVSWRQVLSHLQVPVVQVAFEPLEQEPKVRANAKVRIKLFISIFVVLLARQDSNLRLMD